MALLFTLYDKTGQVREREGHSQPRTQGCLSSLHEFETPGWKIVRRPGFEVGALFQIALAKLSGKAL